MSPEPRRAPVVRSRSVPRGGCGPGRLDSSGLQARVALESCTSPAMGALAAGLIVNERVPDSLSAAGVVAAEIAPGRFDL